MRPGASRARALAATEATEASETAADVLGPVRGSHSAAARFARSTTGIVGLAMLAAVTLLALLGPALSPWDLVTQDFDHLGTPPGVGGHLLGTDAGGLDLLAQLAAGTGRSLLIAAVVGVLTPLLGGVVGATLALWGGRRERVGLWLLDMLLLLPAFLLVAVAMDSLAMDSFRGPLDTAAQAGAATGVSALVPSGSAWLLAGLLTLTGWMPLARVVRAMTRSLRERDFVVAARYLGLSDAQIVRTHLLPHLSSYLLLAVVLGASAAIVTETTLSFLGIGLRPPEVSLGALIGRSTDQVSAYPWLFWAPTAALVWITLALALVGDAARDALDPRGTRGAARGGPVAASAGPQAPPSRAQDAGSRARRGAS